MSDPAPVAPPDYGALYAHDARVTPLEGGLAALTDEHLATYRSQGFLAVNGVFSPERIRAALEGVRDLVLGNVPGFDGVQFERAVRDRLDELTGDERIDGIRKLSGFVRWDDRLAELADDPALRGTVRRLLGGREPHLFQDMGLSKPPRIGAEKPWHQDCAYFNLDQGEPVVGVWIALDRATLDNGCMHVLAGGHHHGPQHHWLRRDWQICDTDVPRLHDKDHPVLAVELEPGGALLFDGLLPHGTPPNASEARRRALQYHYCAADARWVDPEKRLAVFGTEGKDVAC